MKVRKRVCDICGRDLEYYGDLAILQRAESEFGFKFKWKRLDVCMFCADDISNYCEKHRKEKEHGQTD